MNILQINTVCGVGSTGRTATELALMIDKFAGRCVIAYGQGVPDYPHHFKIGTKLQNHLHNLGSRVLGKQGYFSRPGTKKLVRLMEQIRPDVVHLRNLHGNYLHLATLFDYLGQAGLPVVWTLHDCWVYTGKCAHYTAVGCYKWKSECFECPQVRCYPPSLLFDRSRQMFRDKKKWFSAVDNLTLVPVSKWLAGEVRQSFLGRHPVVPIYNWIDQDVFKPTRSAIRERYGIDKDACLVLGVSAAWKSGQSKFADFQKLAAALPKDKQLVLVGKLSAPEGFPPEVIHIPYLHNTQELAEMYSAADVLVHLSMEDTFGKVIAEAMACGTPAVVYNSTACPEVVGEGCGYVVEPRNVDQVLQAIEEIQQQGKEAYRDACIAWVAKNFNYRDNAGQYLDLYRRVSGV